MHENASIPLVDDQTISESAYTLNITAYTNSLSGWSWKVRAEVDEDWGPWSDERTIFVEPVDTDCGSLGSAFAFGDESNIVDGNVTLYPNPIVDDLTVEFIEESVILSEVSIVVYNSQGNIVYASIVESVKVFGFEVDFSSLKADTYFVRISDGNDVRTIRIQKD